MLDWKEISLEDKSIFDKFIRNYDGRASEISFTNFFMWRSQYKFRYAINGNFLCIIAVPEDKEPYCYAPIGSGSYEEFKETVLKIDQYFKKRGWNLTFQRVEEDKVHYFDTCFNGKFECILDINNSDYLYLRDNLVKLGGKKYDGKRNHINKFRNTYEYKWEILDKRFIEEAMRINEEWCENRICDKDGAMCEKIANNELLANYNVLECKGMILSVNGRYEGYTVGEIYSKDMAVIHIEKGNSEIKGIYSFINQQFCEMELEGINYINREQDLGKQGLRKAKMSYHPFSMINKYTIFFNKDKI